MKKQSLKRISLLFTALALAAMMAGCGQSKEGQRENSSSQNGSVIAGDETENRGAQSGSGNLTVEESDAQAAATELEIRFGDNGAPFILQLEDNETAAAIAKHVGTSDWRLPIYHYDDYENWEDMQYYDIPSRYEIPSNPEQVTTEKAGEVYYSEPNRIILFYQDGEVPAEYTRVGIIENTEEFRKAVEENPVLEGWGNKIVLINSME